MLFRVRCPRCGQTAEITEDQLGRQGQCNNCGALVAIPARLSKVCFVCGVDVTHIGHTKDEQSNYLCNNCYQNRQPAELALFSSSKLECSICHIHFPREQARDSMTGPICRECATILQKEQTAEGVIPFASDAPSSHEHEGFVPRAPSPIAQQPRPQFEREMQPALAVAEPPPTLEDLEQIQPTPRPATPHLYAQFLPTPAPQSNSRPSKADRLPLILSFLSLAGVIILATLHFSSRAHKDVQIESNAPALPTQRDNPDQEALTRALILKSQAEVLIEVGKLKEGIEKYDALLRIQSTNPTIAAELESAKSSREKALKLLAASNTQPTVPTTSEEKPISKPDSQKKPRTIFDE